MVTKNNKLGRPPSLTEALNRLKKLGVFQVADAKGVGISQPSLFRFVKEKKIRCLVPRFYIHPESTLTGQELEFALTCKKFGTNSVIGGMTALSHYNLIEQVPNQIWVMVPYSKIIKDPLYKCIRTKTNPMEGIEDKKNYKITNIERSIIEAFRYSSKIGIRTALHASRQAIKDNLTTLDKIYRQAKKLHLEQFIEKYWEAIIPESQAL